jgi:hypothetical protein
MLALGFFLVCRSFLLLGSLAFPLSLERLLFGCLTFALSLLQRLLVCRSFLLLGSLAFPLSLLQGLLSLLSLLSLSLFLLLSSFSLLLVLLSRRLVPLQAFIEVDHVAPCLIKHVMRVDQFDSHRIRGACGEDAGDEDERSDTPRFAPGPSVRISASLVSQ